MNGVRSTSPRRTARPVAPWWLAAGALLLGALVAGPGRARDAASLQARVGLDIARAAAQSWSPDASLIYIENDEALDDTGAATRWGYLFYSAALDRARAYSVSDGRIRVAENLEMKFEAPPLGPQWIDSGAALAAAQRDVGGAYCRSHSGRISTMLLMRGAFQDEHPDHTTWTLVFTAPDTPSLFVMVDAADGRVRRSWRG